MALYKIPLQTTNQKFSIQLGSQTYKLQFIFRINQWFMDVMDTAENYLIGGLPLSSGDNLLIQHQHIITGSMYVLNLNEDESQSYSDLGKEITLYWSDD